MGKSIPPFVWRSFGFALLLGCFSLNALSAVEFILDFADAEEYYVGSPIKMKAKILNDDESTFFFRAADNRMFNLRLKAATLDEAELEPAASYISFRNANEGFFYRSISLEPGEEYGFTFFLDDFVKIEKSGIFIVQGEYLTNLSDRESLLSNQLYLDVSLSDLKEGGGTQGNGDRGNPPAGGLSA